MIDNLLNRLEKVRKTGPDRWIACCPAHVDKTPSLAIREVDDGRILINDFGGCSTEDVLAAIGLTFGDLFPEKLSIDHRSRRMSRPFPATDVLRALAHEALVVALAASHVAKGEPLSQVDVDRVFLAEQRIRQGMKLAGVSHG